MWMKRIGFANWYQTLISACNHCLLAELLTRILGAGRKELLPPHISQSIIKHDICYCIKLRSWRDLVVRRRDSCLNPRRWYEFKEFFPYIRGREEGPSFVRALVSLFGPGVLAYRVNIYGGDYSTGCLISYHGPKLQRNRPKSATFASGH